MFGLVYDADNGIVGGVIRNVNIKNAQVFGNNFVGVIAAYAFTGRIENCHISGTIQVDGNWDVGGITGYTYANITGCSVIADEGSDSYIHGSAGYIGGIVGFVGEGGTKIQNCTVKNMTISTDYDFLGGIAGIIHYGNQFTNNQLINVTLSAAEEAGMVGLFAGNSLGNGSSPSVLTGNTMINTTGTAGDKEINTLWGMDVVSVVNGEAFGVTDEDGLTTFYNTIEDAIKNAEQGQTVTLYNDCVVADTLQIGGLTLDGNGHTISDADDFDSIWLIKVEEEKAEVSEDAVDNAITEASKNETTTDIVLDLNKVAEDAVKDTQEKPAEVVTVQLPVASLEKVAELDEKATLTVTMKEATVTMDVATLEAVTKQAEGSTVTLVVEQIPVEKLTEKQQAAVENKEVVATISAQIICDATGNTIHDFEGGNVSVQIPFTPEEGTKGEDYAVYYVADDGSVEKIETKYVDGHLVVTLEHFSEYVIVNTKANADPSNPATGALSMAPVMALLVINTIGAGALIAGKKRFF